jgi:hypothetical protein
MQILRAFRCNPLRRAAGEFAERKFAGQPVRMGEEAKKGRRKKRGFVPGLI